MTQLNDEPVRWTLYASHMNVHRARSGDFDGLYIRDVTIECGHRKYWFAVPHEQQALPGGCLLRWRFFHYGPDDWNWPARWSEMEVPRDLALRILAHLSRRTIKQPPALQAVFQEAILAEQA